MKKIGPFPANNLIERWLKAGYVDKNTFHQTDIGTPQGGIITPLLANIALDGIEKELNIRYRMRKAENIGGYRLVLDDYVGKGASRRSFIKYADDFVVLCESKEDCLEVKKKLDLILKERGSSLSIDRGLEISEEKRHIRTIEEGSDFLGYTIKCSKWNINVPGERDSKQPGYKVFIMPSNASLKK